MHVSDQDLDLLAKTRGKDLHTLKICTCTGFSEKGLLHISQYCNNLTSLCLEDNGVEDDNELVGKANGEWLRELALCNTSIESLHLRYDFDLYDVENFTLLAEKCSNSLVSLKISPKPLNLLGDAFSFCLNGLDPYAVVMTNHPFWFVTPSLGGKIETMKVGTSNHEKRLAVNRNRETRIVTVPVPGFGMVSLGKVDDSMIVAVTNSCSVMGFEAQTCLQVSADCSGWGFLVDVCWVGECFVETCF
ncbi:ACT domain-containing protein [Tanacetum coccineum]